MVQSLTGGAGLSRLLEKVSSFAVFQEYIVYLNERHELRLFSREKQSDTLIAENAERFFFNGRLMVQNGRSVHVIDINGTYIKHLISSQALDIRLVGIAKGKIYLQIDRSLFEFDDATKQWKELCGGYGLFMAVNHAENGIQIAAADVDEASEAVRRKIITISNEALALIAPSEIEGLTPG